MTSQTRKHECSIHADGAWIHQQEVWDLSATAAAAQYMGRLTDHGFVTSGSESVQVGIPGEEPTRYTVKSTSIWIATSTT